MGNSKEVRERFSRLCDEIVGSAANHSPEWATYLGIHDRDGELTCHDDTSYLGFRGETAQLLEELSDIDRDSLERSERVDHQLARSRLEGILFEYDREDYRQTRPGAYLPVGSLFVLLVREFAPAAERVRSVIARLEKFAEPLAEARKHLTNPPRLWTEMAVEQAQGGLGFLSAVPQMAEEGLSQDPSLKGPLQSALEKAACELRSYIEYLQNDVLPGSDGEFSVGGDAFNFYLSNSHMLTERADDLYEFGTRMVAETREHLESVASQISPGEPWHEVLERVRADHPQPGELREAYGSAMEHARKFVSEHDLATIPEGQELEMIDTPQFARHVLPFAAYQPPAPLEEQQKGFFYVTPIPEDADAARREELLRGHSRHWITVVALHEGYPGHHLQFVHAGRIGSDLRKTWGTSVFIEGWALYCEQMMGEEGFYAGPETRLVMLSARMWRACRVMLDVSLHVRGMSVSDAIDFLESTAHLKREQCESEVKRYTQTPTQPMSYLVGMNEILKLRDRVRKTEGEAFSLKGFHDRLLSAGSIPVCLVAETVFGV